MAMSEFGAYLQRQRLERGLSLEDVEEATRIRRKYLEAMEAGDWDALPPGVYTRGLVKSYARAIGTSPASALRMYVKERPGEARLPEPQLISQPLIRETRFSFEMVLAAAVLVVAVSLFAWTILNQVSLPSMDGGAPAADGITATAAAAGTSPAAGTAAPSAGGTSPARTAAPRATRTPPPSPSPTPADGLHVTIDVTSDVWLELQVDDGQRVSGFLRPGDDAIQHVDAEGYVYLKTGNAGATKVTINGADVGSLGKPGEVKVYEWRRLPDGAVEQNEVR